MNFKEYRKYLEDIEGEEVWGMSESEKLLRAIFYQLQELNENIKNVIKE